MLIFTLTLITGCASYTKPPTNSSEYEKTRPALPAELTEEIELPELPSHRIKNEELIVLIGDYLKALKKANIDRKLTREYCGDERQHPNAAK